MQLVYLDTFEDAWSRSQCLKRLVISSFNGCTIGESDISLGIPATASMAYSERLTAQAGR